MLIEVQTIAAILFYEVLGPFYVFQLFAIVLWSLDAYYYYGSSILILTAISLVSSVLQIHKNQRQLRATIHGHTNVTVWRGNEQYDVIPSTELVPGDVIVLEPASGFQVQCDAVIISGNVLVDERFE